MQKEIIDMTKSVGIAGTGLAVGREFEPKEAIAEGKLIIYVEDDKEWIQMVSEALRDSGYTVKSFTDLTIAESFLQTNKEKVQLVICDGTINEKFDGLGLARKLSDTGYKTLILSSAILPNRFLKDIPMADKLDFYSKEFAELVNKTIGN